MPNFGIQSSEGLKPIAFEDIQLGGSSSSLQEDVKTTPFERRFNPYDFNGGTTVVIAGEDYAIAAGCTRMSTGYEILSRKQSKLFDLYVSINPIKWSFLINIFSLT